MASAIVRSTGNSAVTAAVLDLSEQSSVWEFANAWSGPLDILVNNAEIMALPDLQRTAEGWELQLATNYLGHFALTLGLHAALKAAHGARVVSLSSSGSLFSPVIFGDPHFNYIPYTPLVAYGQSKTAQALFAVEVTQRWSHEGILANSFSSGTIATDAQIHIEGLETSVERRKTVAQSVATSILLAASPLLEGVGGRYFEDCNEASVVSSRPTDLHGVAPYALDPTAAHALWELSLALVHRP
jgi:NAD(P)-dependent dehydrogenase (short-subunit alcohol dehydrogenase family)